MNVPEDEQYIQFLLSVRVRFASLTADGGPLFSTSGELNFFQVFLNALPIDRRQYYTCRACRRFVHTFGRLVTVGPAGALVPALWDLDYTPPLFQASVKEMVRAVTQGPISSVFLCSDEVWGHPRDEGNKAPGGIWEHLSVTPAKELLYRPTSLSASQAMALKREEHGMLGRGLGEFGMDTIRRAHTLLTTAGWYRSEKCIHVAKWLVDLTEELATAASSVYQDNLLWRAVATAPAGYCHVRTTSIGRLMENIQAGLPLEEIKRRFEVEMAPERHGRAQAAPSEGQLDQAEKLVTTMGLAPSLLRRYARLQELPCLWHPKKSEPVKPTGVFGHLKSDRLMAQATALEIPAQVITWEKFRRTVLPNALRIEAQIPSSSNRLAALVTAVHPEAPPILQWDREEARNPVSWYYAAGIDAEMRRRVLDAGGVYDDVDIRATLMWHNRNDLDLHVITPTGFHIFFADMQSRCLGWLDVDMNRSGETTKPVENIRWQKGTARAGRYRVYVQNYAFHELRREPTPFSVEIEVNGQVSRFEGVISPHGETGTRSDITVAEFDYVPGQRLANARWGLPEVASSTSNSWNVTPGKYTLVSGIVESPNLWGDKPVTHHGRHVFFLLDGCRDMSEGVGRGFFTETLRSELHAIRSTLEAYTARAAIAGREEADACGLGMNDQTPWDLTVRVTMAEAVVTYRIDRWD